MDKLDNIKIPDNFDSSIDIAIYKALNDKQKIKSKKRKLIVAGSSIVLLGTIALNSETTWAYIDNITKQIEILLGREENEFDNYKFEGNQTVESNGLKISLGEVMLDDRQLIISMSVDYSKFKDNLNIETLLPLYPTIIIDDLVFEGQSNSCEVEKVKGEKKGNILFKTSLLSIDTDGDGISDTPYEILDKIEGIKDYDLKIIFNEMHNYGNEEFEAIRGNWEFNTIINASNILNDTKVHKINKTFKIDEKVYKGDFTIDEIRVSPVSVKIKYNYDLYTELSANKRREPVLIAKDENDNELMHGSGTGGELIDGKWHMGDEFELKGNEKKISVIPCIYVNDNPKMFKDAIVDIDIN